MIMSEVENSQVRTIKQVAHCGIQEVHDSELTILEFVFLRSFNLVDAIRPHTIY